MGFPPQPRPLVPLPAPPGAARRPSQPGHRSRCRCGRFPRSRFSPLRLFQGVFCFSCFCRPRFFGDVRALHFSLLCTELLGASLSPVLLSPLPGTVLVLSRLRAARRCSLHARRTRFKLNRGHHGHCPLWPRPKLPQRSGQRTARSTKSKYEYALGEKQTQRERDRERERDIVREREISVVKGRERNGEGVRGGHEQRCAMEKKR